MASLFRMGDVLRRTTMGVFEFTEASTYGKVYFEP